MQYAWFIWSLLLIAVWLAVYCAVRAKDKRREMLVVGLWTALTGLAEPIFVPEYWNPPSLFNLAQTTGFDIESIIFSFGTGGLAVILYEWLFRSTHEKMPQSEHHYPQHQHHLLATLSAPIVFLVLFFFTNINAIYSVIIALTAGGLAAWYCRPDLKKKMLASALIFLGFYSAYFLVLVALYPGYVEQVWNLAALSGILVAGIPLEELLFAASFGFLWSSVYEHFTWRGLKNNKLKYAQSQ